MKNVLIIDRSDVYLKKVKRSLPSGFQLFTASRSHMALLRICENDLDLIMLTTNIGDINPFLFLSQIITLIPGIPVIILDRTYNQETDTLVKKRGAFAYLEKPENPRRLESLIKEATNSPKPKDFLERKLVLNSIVGTSRETALMKQTILTYSQSESPILLLGESGTGKDLAATCIHKLSKRNDHPCIHINCGAIPPTLVESELFGVEKGAYTDAVTTPGKFEQANGGTVFLNEIGELPIFSQVKLLKILESGSVIRVGGQKERPLNIRIISATNKNLKKETREKRFRLDLLYRINTLYMEILPLRKRREDIPPLASRILTIQDSTKEFTLNALEKLCEHNWPGNIRELKNVIERARLLSLDSKIRSTEIQFFNL